MRKNKQLITDRERGDCFRACMTSILGIANDPALPAAGDPEWFQKWWKFLADIGMEFHCRADGFWHGGYWIASVPSKNYPDVTHAIVMCGQEIAHDPTTTENAYTAGENLLGKKDAKGEKIVRAGYWLTVTDTSKLHVLVEMQRGLDVDAGW